MIDLFLEEIDIEDVRLARERICGAVNDGWSIKADDVAVILGELDRLRAERDAIRDELVEAKRLAGGGCDASAGGYHTVVKQGTYAFCAECGESLRRTVYVGRSKATP